MVLVMDMLYIKIIIFLNTNIKLSKKNQKGLRLIYIYMYVHKNGEIDGSVHAWCVLRCCSWYSNYLVSFECLEVANDMMPPWARNTP